MPVQFKIAVTREILESSLRCGTSNNIEEVGRNCAIALAVKDIFPDVLITGDCIYPFGSNRYTKTGSLKIELPQVAKDFIKVFDSLSAIPKVRRCLPQFDFEISLSDEIIAQINIGEVNALIDFPRRAVFPTAIS